MPAPVTITPTEIEGVVVVETGIFHDDRGFFTETFSEPQWAAQGFRETFLQDNLSKSKKGTLRGMHYQIEPAGMGKLVRCITGSVFDAGIDIRKGSPTFGKWVGRELSGENGLALYFPPGFAHGFVALEDDTLVHYKCTNVHTPEAERGVRYNDPAVGIEWPLEPTVVTDKDRDAPLLADAEYNFTYSG